MASAPSLAPAPAPRAQFWLCCRSCGSSQIRAVGLCASCYAARRRDLLRFGGFRLRVLERDRHRCRVCGEGESAKLRIHVHHRQPGISREKLLIALCPGCHARVHRLRVLDRILLPMALELWRELHPGAPEQLFLDFAPAAAAPPGEAWLWEQYRAG